MISFWSIDRQEDWDLGRGTTRVFWGGDADWEMEELNVHGKPLSNVLHQSSSLSGIGIPCFCKSVMIWGSHFCLGALSEGHSRKKCGMFSVVDSHI